MCMNCDWLIERKRPPGLVQTLNPTARFLWNLSPIPASKETLLRYFSAISMLSSGWPGGTWYLRKSVFRRPAPKKHHKINRFTVGIRDFWMKTRFRLKQQPFWLPHEELLFLPLWRAVTARVPIFKCHSEGWKVVLAAAVFGLLARLEKRVFSPKSKFNRVEMCAS